MNENWYSSKVYEGEKVGRALGFPTINLDSDILPQNTLQGVYSSLVEYDNKKYIGALYFGPRQVFGQTKIVLEIYLLDFDKEIYGEIVRFKLVKHIRGLIKLPSVEALIDQMKKDIKSIKG